MKKVLALILALMMVLSILVACGPADTDNGGDDTSAESNVAGNSGNNSGNTDNSGDSSSDGAGNENVQIGNLDPSINLNEKEIVILSRGHSAYADEVCVESANGDPIDEAVIKRQADVERTLNCKIKNVKVNESSSNSTKSVDYNVIEEIKLRYLLMPHKLGRDK